MANRRNKEVNRPKRIPVSGNRDVLTVEGKEDGFIYRWANDVDDRLSKFLAAGYEFVEDEVKVGESTVDNTVISNKSGAVSKNVGKGVIAYLVRIDEDWYNEDQSKKGQDIREREADMKRQLNSGVDGQYGDVTIS